MPAVRVGHHDDWPTLGWEIVEWAERYLCHGPGDVEGNPLVLDDEFVQVILDCYRLYPKRHVRAGQRVVTRAGLSRAKGRAKSELAGIVVCAEAQGPVRFDGWNAKGDPVGKPIRSPFIRCLATEESQAGNTYDNVTYMLAHAAEHDPEEFGGVDIGKSAQASSRVYLAGSGEIRPSTASSAAKDGGKETFAVADETHLYIGRELLSMHRMVSRNLRKRRIAQPWMLDTTTAPELGQGSIAETVLTWAEKILEGKREAGGFYWNHREGFEVDDWKDDAQVLAALREAYGDAVEWMDLELILAEDIRGPEATEPDSRRYWLNQARGGMNRAFDSEQWPRLAKPKTRIKNGRAGRLITIGVQGARFEDGLAMVATDVLTGHQWPLGIWETPDNADDNYEHPLDEVDGVMLETFDEFGKNVWRVYADPSYIEGLVDDWAGRWGAKRIISWQTNRHKQMAYAVRNFRQAQAAAAIAATKMPPEPPGYSHDGDALFAKHIKNALRQPTSVKDEKGRPMWVIQKESAGSPLTIAGAKAAVLSWEARGDAIAAGATARKKSEAFFL